MSGIEDRGEAFEKKFAHDAELLFKAQARRNKLLGVWAAEKLGTDAADVDAYAKSVVRSDFEEPGDEDVFRKIRADFDDNGVSVSDEELRSKMTELLEIAKEQVAAE